MAKILLVEDDKSLREIYGVRLMAEGYEIVSAGDGEEALAMAIKERPDLIVSDVMMPKISGFDMLDILRSTTETKDVKVIMMTALSSEDQRARGEALGADRYLVKSQVGIEDVVRTVHDVLGDGVPGATPAPSNPQPPTPQTPPPTIQPPTPEPQASAMVGQDIAPAAQAAPAPAPMPEPTQPTPQPEPAAALAPTPDPQPAIPTPNPQSPTTTLDPATGLVIPTVTPAAPVPDLAQPPTPQTPPPTNQPPTPNPQQPTTTPEPLPQPTAPFSSPAPASLGERVIEPLTSSPQAAPAATPTDISAQIAQALGEQQQPPQTPPNA